MRFGLLNVCVFVSEKKHTHTGVHFNQPQTEIDYNLKKNAHTYARGQNVNQILWSV